MTQPLSGINQTTYNANAQQINQIFTQAILICVNDLAAISTGRTLSRQNIVDLSVVSARRRLASQDPPAVATCLLSYKVASSNAGISAGDLSSTLASAASSGAFIKNVKQLASTERVSALYNVSSAGAAVVENLNAQKAQALESAGSTTSLITMASIGAAILFLLGAFYGAYYLRKHSCRRADVERDSRTSGVSSTASGSLSASGAPTFVGRGYRRESSASPKVNDQGPWREPQQRRATDFTGDGHCDEHFGQERPRRPTLADIIPAQASSARGPSLLVPTAGQLHRDRIIRERSLREAEEQDGEEGDDGDLRFPVLGRGTSDKPPPPPPRVLHAL